MVDLANGEFEFNGFQFGSLATGYPLAPGGFTVGETTYRTEDVNDPYGDGVLFGRDYVNPLTYSFSLVIFQEGTTKWADAAQAIGAFRKAWRTAVEKNQPGSFTTLFMYHGSRMVQVFGRPRGFAVDRVALRHGVARVTVQFTANDDRVFHLSKSTVMGINPPSTGGLVAPLIAPLTTVSSGVAREGTFQVEGEGNAPLELTFTGPVINPSIDFVGRFSVGLDTTLLDGQSVKVSTLDRTVLRNDGASLAGALTRLTPKLEAIVLPPGNHVAMFRGVSESGLSTAKIEWYPVGYST